MMARTEMRAREGEGRYVRIEDNSKRSDGENSDENFQRRDYWTMKHLLRAFLKSRISKIWCTLQRRSERLVENSDLISIPVIPGGWSAFENLPDAILVEILNRVRDSTDLGRCRLVSKRIRSVSYQVSSIRVISSYDRVLRSRTANSTVVPFKSSILNLLSLFQSRHLQSLSLGLEYPNCLPKETLFLNGLDDLHLTEFKFLSAWLPAIGKMLTNLEITTYLPQSEPRKSELLPLISNCCEKLVSLKVKNAWLSVEGLKPFAMLTRLAFVCVKVEDKHLNVINACFPSLQVLTLVGIWGLKDPKLHLPKLMTCYWHISSFPLSLIICAARLTELKLNCITLKSFTLEAPSLRSLDICVKNQIDAIEVENFRELKSLKMRSSSLGNLAEVFGGSMTVNFLEIETVEFSEFSAYVRAEFGGYSSADSEKPSEIISLHDLGRLFPETNNLKLGRKASWKIMKPPFAYMSPFVGWEWRSLKKITVYLLELELNCAFMSYIQEVCPLLCEVVIILPYHPVKDHDEQDHYMARVAERYPTMKWSYLRERIFINLFIKN